MLTSFLAEIGDKESGLVTLWTVGVTLMLLTYGTCGVWRWTTLIIIPCAAWWFVAGVEELTGEGAWQAGMTADLGHAYVLQAHATHLMPLLGVLLAWVVPFRRVDGDSEVASIASLP